MVDLNKLKEIKEAILEGLITQEEYEKLRQDIVNSTDSSVSPITTKLNLDLAQLLGISGSFILFVGAFAPIVSAPLVGGLNIANTDIGLIFIILAVLSLIFSLIKKYSLLWITGLASICLITIKVIDIAEDLDSVFIQLQWGAAIIFVGSILIILSAAYQSKITKQVRNTIAYLLLFNMTISSYIFAFIHSYLDFQYFLSSFITGGIGILLLTKENHNISFIRKYNAIVSALSCLIAIFESEIFTALILGLITTGLGYKEVVNLNKALNNKARKRKMKRNIASRS